MRLLIATLATTMFLAGCKGDHGMTSTPDKGVPTNDSAPPSPPSCKTVPADQDRDLDILFVIDNSIDMTSEQEMLIKQFPSALNTLLSHPSGASKPNLRIGVVSTDLGAGTLYIDAACKNGGDKGKLHTRARKAGCTPPTDPWIVYDGTSGTTNIPGSGSADSKVISAFSCIARLGDTGCGYEQTLLSAKLAVSGANPGFLRNGPTCTPGREDAILAVLFLSDEDDCSAADDRLFNPFQSGLNDPLGPLSSFRCFEFGVTCECPGHKNCDRFYTGPRQKCVPASSGYLQKVEDLIAFFRDLKRWPSKDLSSGRCVAKANPYRVVIAAIAGPTDSVSTEMVGSVPELMPSSGCTNRGLGLAVPAIRIEALVHAFAGALTPTEIAAIKSGTKEIPYFVDEHGAWREENFNSSCASDFRPALKRFAESINKRRGTRCVDFGK